MFTGLVEELGVVRRLERSGNGGRLVIRAHKVLDGTKLGDSVAVSGACVTVVSIGRDEFAVDCMPETLTRTTLGRLGEGTQVNLERSVKVGDRLGGHLVLGHVDAVTQVLGVDVKGGAREVRFGLPDAVRAYVAAKGSIAIDGISLTVMRVDDSWFDVGIIPYTLKETTMRGVSAGLSVNLEADVIARYVQRSVELAGKDGSHPGPQQGLTEDLLREKGFV